MTAPLGGSGAGPSVLPWPALGGRQEPTPRANGRREIRVYAAVCRCQQIVGAIHVPAEDAAPAVRRCAARTVAGWIRTGYQVRNLVLGVGLGRSVGVEVCLCPVDDGEG